jgi:putative transposase
MARMPRSLLPDGIYHVTTRGVDRCTIFFDDADHIFFLLVLASVVRDFAWECYAMCLMTNHYHLVVETVQPLLSAGMHRLNGRHAEEFNRKYDRTGHLFGDRFGTRVVEDEGHLRNVCAYVINNPVRAGLCATAADWRWNACRFGLELD